MESITERYMLCALNDKGKIPALSSEIPVCIVAGAVMDLALAGCVAVDNKRLTVSSPLSGGLRHLTSIYDYIAEKEKIKLDKLASEYCFSFSGKRINRLIDEIGMALSEAHSVTVEQGGLLGTKKHYIPDGKAVDSVVQTIRAELLEEGTMSDEAIALAGLFEKSGMLKKYFSSYEKKALKSRMEEIKNSPSHEIISEFMDYINTMIAVIAVTSMPK
ncbi:GOLPH3/VPS74 family protein [Anaerolentibacter hominis]|uniref:GOLPH3/VPS74 family protein n=1 Tax=Anaerolentibacter hominis TaxID=3079009 RepID=UPI0031B81BE6